MDTGAEVILISSSIIGTNTEMRKTEVHQISITHQPITVIGEADLPLMVGTIETTDN